MFTFCDMTKSKTDEQFIQSRVVILSSYTPVIQRGGRKSLKNGQNL